MATYYWVGGSGTWSNTATTNWATSSGGAGGAGVPTSADDVVFNSSSNATGYTVTISTGAVCKSMTANGPASGTVTFGGTTGGLTVYGSFTLASTGVSFSTSRDLYLIFAATTVGNTITTNGVTVGDAEVTMSGTGSYSLGSALTFTRSLTITAGTLTTNNYNISCNWGFNLTGGTLNLGSSTFTIGGFNGAWLASGNSVINAGTSTLSITGYDGGFATGGGGRSLNNVVFNTSLSYAAIGGSWFSAASNTDTVVNNLVFDASYGGTSTNGVKLWGNLTINQALSSINATEARNRIVFFGSSTTTQRTVSAASTSLTDFDFGNINAVGAGAPFTGTRISDLGNNSNVTPSAAKTVYWNLSGNKNWYDNAWASTSGGSPSLNNYPLIQDTAVIDNAGAANTITIPGIGGGTRRYGAINATSRTLPFSMSGTNHYIEIYGNVKLGSAVSGSLSAYLNFVLRSPTTEIQIPISVTECTFTGNGSQNVVMTGALTATGTNGIKTSSSGLITNGYNLTSPSVSFTSGTQTVDFGNSTITCTDTGQCFNFVSGNLLANSSNIVLSSTSNSAARTFAGGSKSYGTLTINGGNTTSQVVNITNSNSFKAIKSDKTVAWTLRFTAGANNSFETWSLNGSSGNLLTLGSTSTSLTTLTYSGTSNISFDYASVSYISGRPANFKWFAGANSTDGGNNSAVYFRTPIDPSKGNFFMFF